jgi:hypothetical protein
MSQIVAGEVADEAGYAAMFVTLSVFGCLAWLCIFLLNETGLPGPPLKRTQIF